MLENIATKREVSSALQRFGLSNTFRDLAPESQRAFIISVVNAWHSVTSDAEKEMRRKANEGHY